MYISNLRSVEESVFQICIVLRSVYFKSAYCWGVSISKLRSVEECVFQSWMVSQGVFQNWAMSQGVAISKLHGVKQWKWSNVNNHTVSVPLRRQREPQPHSKAPYHACYNDVTCSKNGKSCGLLGNVRWVSKLEDSLYCRTYTCSLATRNMVNVHVYNCTHHNNYNKHKI